MGCVTHRIGTTTGLHIELHPPSIVHRPSSTTAQQHPSERETQLEGERDTCLGGYDLSVSVLSQRWCWWGGCCWASWSRSCSRAFESEYEVSSSSISRTQTNSHEASWSSWKPHGWLVGSCLGDQRFAVVASLRFGSPWRPAMGLEV
jgi:hypothetical protein